jgi:hypothetical protein
MAITPLRVSASAYGWVIAERSANAPISLAARMLSLVAASWPACWSSGRIWPRPPNGTRRIRRP